MLQARTVENVAMKAGLQGLSRLRGMGAEIVLVCLLFPDDFGIFDRDASKGISRHLAQLVSRHPS